MISALYIGRFQPFHNGHLSVIEKIIRNGEKPLIVIGSAQEKNTWRNPLDAEEREILIKETLREKGILEKDYEIGKLNDLGDYEHWSNYIHKILPPFEKVYTGSELVTDCLLGKYSDPESFPKKIPEIVKLERKIRVKATMIREKIVRSEEWENLVPEVVAKFLKKWDIYARLKIIKMSQKASKTDNAGLSKTMDLAAGQIDPTASQINPQIFRAYDIRGIAEGIAADLTEETVYLIGKGTGTYLREKYQTKNMAIGRDVRLHSEKLQKAFIKGVTDADLDVTDLGLCTSPMIYWASCAAPFDSATNITASHNPREYNGIKTVTRGAHSICGDELQEILKIIQNNFLVNQKSENFLPGEKQKKFSHQISKNRSSGKISTQNIWPEYKQDLISKINLARPLKIVVDAGNGAAGPFIADFLRALKTPDQKFYEIIELYCEPDGNFPNHEANPEELHNMQDLISKVKEEKADLGIGFDGDGDRVGVIDEKGHMYSSDFMLLLLTRDLLTRQKNPQIVFDVKISQAIINDMQTRGAIPVMSKTGHSFIEKKMKELSAPLAGEVSGHIFFGTTYGDGENPPQKYYGFDDAFLAAGKIIEILSKSDKPLSEQFTDLPKVFTTPEFKAPCPDDKKFQIVQKLVDHFTKIYDCITLDGVRINFDQTSWGAVRASNTSPCLTLRFEADTPEKLHEIQKIMAAEFKKYPEADLSWFKKND